MLMVVKEARGASMSVANSCLTLLLPCHCLMSEG
jgi:hypothetical protein